MQTGGGAENGKAVCSFRFSEDGTWIEFFDTFSNEHSQEFTQMLSGLHIIYVRCEDAAGNIAESSTSFKLNLDKNAPKITRVYSYSGSLHLFTDEDAECVYSNENCNFVWENATKMTGLMREHEASWLAGQTYFIKCKDNFNNRPGLCSITVQIY